MLPLLEGKLVFIFCGPIYTFMDFYLKIVHMYFFLLLSQRFYFENTVTSKFMNYQAAIKLSIKNTGSAFWFTDTQSQLGVCPYSCRGTAGMT